MIQIMTGEDGKVYLVSDEKFTTYTITHQESSQILYALELYQDMIDCVAQGHANTNAQANADLLEQYKPLAG